MNKMAGWLRVISQWGFTQICVTRGSVSWGSEDNDAAGELQLWHRERDNDYYLYVSNTAGDEMVCTVIRGTRRQFSEKYLFGRRFEI